MTIGQNIKKYRKDAKLTQEELANKIGVIQSNIYRWEKNVVVPSIDTIKKLSKILLVSADALLFTEEERKKFKITDKELLNKLKDLEQLNDKDKQTIVNLIESLSSKTK